MARFDFEDSDNHLSAVAQSCRFLKAGAGSQGKSASEGVTCSICSNWDGNSCSRREFNNMLNELELD